METSYLRHDKIQDGISAALEAFDMLELTMVERWYVSLCICQSAEGIMGESVRRLHEELSRWGEKRKDEDA